MGVSHGTIRELLKTENNELLNVFNSIVNNISGSKLLSDIILFLDDDNVLLKNISDKNKVSLVSLMKLYYIACGDTFIVDSKLDKLVAVAKQEIYSIDAKSGIRIATKSEVDNGVNGLIMAEKCFLSNEKYKLLNLLLWTITGRLSYFKQAGFEYNYDKEIGLIDTVYDLIVRSGAALKDMINWVSNKKEFNLDTNILKQALKNGSYKYPEYAADEIRADISVKQLLFYLTKNLPRRSENQKYKDALYLVLKEQSNKYFKLTPGNISFMRSIYSELVSGEVKATRIDTCENIALKEECDCIILGRSSGIIKENHFALKIISTLQKYNYGRCTKKQYEIIKEATKLIEESNCSNSRQKEVNGDTPIIFDIDAEIAGSSLVDISNALGKGQFEIGVEMAGSSLVDISNALGSGQLEISK